MICGKRLILLNYMAAKIYGFTLCIFIGSEANPSSHTVCTIIITSIVSQSTVVLCIMDGQGPPHHRCIGL